ncbi:uncharacterized protein LOC111041202 [Myzus persicae]|uniref:uncharacterized protein LOC111041202 n=1 Tax=Myzus persicae TaxID=13164 RepID=UPI000B9331D4|nr:uncharacterized protein LOC111041202 [Myzus persicae]
MTRSKSIHRPNLPLGEYRFVFHTMHPCETTQDLKLKMNLYLSKKTRNITEVKGNLTFLTPLDDSLIFDYNLSSWSLTGGWKPNSFVYIVNMACSKMKAILGNCWTSLQKAFKIPTGNCPVPSGIYTTAGLDIKAIADDNKFPKIFYYGKYKLVAKLRNKENKLLGCLSAEFDLVRPWEVPTN